MFSIFCKHNWVNIGTGYDDLWKCASCGKTTERDPAFIHSWLCDHEWESWGVMDDYYKCRKCGKIKNG